MSTLGDIVSTLGDIMSSSGFSIEIERIYQVAHHMYHVIVLIY